GLLWAGDGGADRVEEVNVIRRGGNYGWNRMEGTFCFPPDVETCDQTGLELPLFEYFHPDPQPVDQFEYSEGQGCSIIGGPVYRGASLPSLVGAYIYGDLCTGQIWSLQYDGTAVQEQRLLVDSELRIFSFGVDENAELYIMGAENWGELNEVHRIYRLASLISSG
ncbi:MAG: PQQ-dependent sugar dehydrogenase, partial [Candidatus Marinimicrobia bacterium]|nr:PQQ-dependent sugar dehydrogenase [Candidatus Neomarinimicrobiota bacterium]